MQVKSPLPSAKDGLKSTQAFTLVELLVVVFIIAVLTALLFPMGRQLIEKGAAITCANHMRQLGTAMFASRQDHNGWFPPGYPLRAGRIKAIDQQPGMPEQPGFGSGFTQDLVRDGYLDQLPVCPLAQLDPAFRAANPSPKKYFQARGGTYAINALLLQRKIESLPPQWWYNAWKKDYKESHMTFLLETAWGGVTWSFSHSDQALHGLWYSGPPNGTRVTMPRSHGRGDTLNFMFLDQHIELVSKNDPRDISKYIKSWVYYTNPKGRFHVSGHGDRFISPSTMSDATFKTLYPQFFPPPVPTPTP